MTLTSEKFWETLLTKIEEGRVIPVIGPGVIPIELDGRIESLETLIARRLAKRVGIGAEAENGTTSLHDVVARAHRQDPQEDFHSEVHGILRDLRPLTPPEPLQALARITDFKLYISLTFDSLLLRAIEEARDIREPEQQHIGYAPNLRQVDLPAPLRQLKEPHVYALFGKACSAPEFVISDEDLLEWITALQDPDNRPQQLFDALRSHHLLFIGCALPDWLVRFFLRLTREGRVSATRSSETLIDAAMQDQSRLVAFLDHFSPRTTFLDANPVEFVRQLEERWQKQKQLVTPATLTDVPADLRAGGVFLSYASNDTVAASQLRGALAGRQIDTWFDAQRLRSGASYDKVIERNIGLCGVIIVVMSQATLTRLQRWRDDDNSNADKKPYFLREWELALARDKLFAGSLTICPIYIDAVNLHDAIIPEGLRKLTCESIPGGNAEEAFLDRIKKAVREQRKKGGV